MHPSMTRLLTCAQEATKGQRRAITDFKELGARLGESSAVISNWKSRGISKDGALKASRLFGCSATWLIDGKGDPGKPDARLTEETPTGPDALDAALEVLAKALTEADEERRAFLGHSLSRLVEDPSRLSNISQNIRSVVFTNGAKSPAPDTGAAGKQTLPSRLQRAIGPKDDGEHLPVSQAQGGGKK